MVGQTRFDNGNRKFSRTRFLRVRPRVPDEPSGFCPTKARKFRISAFRNTRRRAEASEIAVTKNMRSWRLPRHFLIKIARIRRFSQKSAAKISPPAALGDEPAFRALAYSSTTTLPIDVRFFLAFRHILRPRIYKDRALRLAIAIAAEPGV